MVHSAMFVVVVASVTGCEAPPGVDAVAVTGNGEYVAGGGRDGVVHVWSLTSGERVVTLRGHYYAIREVTFSPSADRLVTFDGDVVRVWKVSDGSELVHFTATTRNSLEQIAFTSDGTSLVAIQAASMGQRRLVRFDVENPSNTQVSLTWKGRGELAENGETVALFDDDDQALKIWRDNEVRHIAQVRDEDLVLELALSSDGSRLAAILSQPDGVLMNVYDTATRKGLSSEPLKSRPRTAVMSQDGSVIMTQDAGYSVRVYHARDDHARSVRTGALGRIDAIAVCATKPVLVMAGENMNIGVTDYPTGEAWQMFASPRSDAHVAIARFVRGAWPAVVWLWFTCLSALGDVALALSFLRRRPVRAALNGVVAALVGGAVGLLVLSASSAIVISYFPHVDAATFWRIASTGVAIGATLCVVGRIALSTLLLGPERRVKKVIAVVAVHAFAWSLVFILASTYL
jgi:hypothetical protein